MAYHLRITYNNFVFIFLASKTSKKKLPAGAVPLFGSSGLFTPEEEKSVTFDDASTVKSEVHTVCMYVYSSCGNNMIDRCIVFVCMYSYMCSYEAMISLLVINEGALLCKAVCNLCVVLILY